MSDDLTRLVEQARAAVARQLPGCFPQFDPKLVAGLADAVEQLQSDLNQTLDVVDGLRALRGDNIRERDEARARVAALEADREYAVDQLVAIREAVLEWLGEGHPIYERHIHDVMSSPAAIPGLVRELLDETETPS